MRQTSIRGVVADTCFWIEAFDPKGEYHAKAAAFLEDLCDSVILMPWPIMYEVLRTETVRRDRMAAAFQRVLTFRKICRIDDAKYREACLEKTFAMAARKRPIGLVDMVVREVLSDTQFRVSQLLTFNLKDFQDICQARNIAVWPTMQDSF